MAAIRIYRRLRELLDVAISSPSDGDVLAYNDTTSKWENSAAAAGGGSSTLLGLTDVAGTDGAGKAPVSDGADTFTLTDVATQAELDAHAADTTSVHGIADTSVLETTAGSQTKADAAETAAASYADSAVATHSADTTGVHGIADTSALETTAGAQSKADSAETAAESYADTAVATHSSDTTSVHGIADTSALYAAGGTDVAVADGGTGASTAAAARTNLGLVVGTDVQAHDGLLDSLVALAANRFIARSSAGAAAAKTITDAALALLDDADASAMLSTLGVSSFIQSLLDDADAATARSTLGITGGQTQLDYVEITSNVTITATADGNSGGTAVIDGNAVTYDGATRICVEFYASAPFFSGQLASHTGYINLYDGTNDIGQMIQTRSPVPATTGSMKAALFARRFLTPSAGSHTFHIRGWKDNAADTYVVLAGSGGASAVMPGYMRITTA